MTAENVIKKLVTQADYINSDVKFEGGYYQPDEVINQLTRSYRREWDKAAFLGNGLTGAMIYKQSEQTLMWELGRNDVLAHNFLKGIDWATPRVPIGNILLEVKGKIVSESMHLHLYNATVTGQITTELGSVSYSSYIPRDLHGVCIETKTTGEEKAVLSVQPKHGISDRIYFSKQQVNLALLPPEPYIKTDGDITYSTQEFLRDDGDSTCLEGACVLAFKQSIRKNKTVFFLSICNGMDKEAVREEALHTVNQFFSETKAIWEAHAAWWHTYFGKSCLKVSDEKWQNFYWMQMYKIACSIRPDGVVLDSQGPFMTTTPWPTTVWNLNVELSYSPVVTSNHMELMDSLIRVLKENRQNLIDNAKPLGIEDGMYLSRSTSDIDLRFPWPDTYEMGNLFWALYTVNRKAQVTEDKKLIKELLFPYMKMAVNSCRVLLKEDENHTLHLMDTSSPEYPVKKGVNWLPIKDCTYTLSLLKWGLKKLLEWNKKYKFKDELESEWERISQNLANYPVDENGFRIGADVPYSTSHRHFSHLMMIYPLMTMDFNDQKMVETAKKSINHWLGLSERLQGYTFTAASGMMSCLLDGEKAYEYLNGLSDYLCQNTMYSEKGPVIETPISAAESMHMMVLQSHNSLIRLFPAVPECWQDVSFEHFMADGGFIVSATLKNHKFVKAEITSLHGNPLNLMLPGGVEAVITSEKPITVKKSEGSYTIKMKKGTTITIQP